MCTSFQKRVVSILTKKTKHALQEYKVKNLIVAGGVAANQGLRKSLEEMAKENDIHLSYPDRKSTRLNSSH